ncbi:MAG: S46 family peptidase [Saprospiraceae bacterium]
MRYKFTSILSCIFLIASSLTLKAGEGMWLPMFLGQLNEAEMRTMGLKITAADIYSVNKGSLKDAIVLLGGCTAELVSGTGLLLTNHHCGYDAIVKQSTIEHNYVENGFWAMQRNQELSSPSLSATFIVRMDEITQEILGGVRDNMSESERTKYIDQQVEKLKASYAKESWQGVMIKPFFEQNRYFIFVTETYNDIRLVGAPPSSIGKFGSDTDNWVWPRHTGDFSMFRIYADKNNRPADYSAENVPFTPRHFLPISLDGVKEGDFSMVIGFPGTTDEYLPAAALEVLTRTTNPARIGIRDRVLSTMDREMRASESIKLLYATRYATVANYWKKWIGENQGLKSTKAVEKRREYEAEFTGRLAKKPELQEKYGELINTFNTLYTKMEPYMGNQTLYSEFQQHSSTITLSLNCIDLINQFNTKGEAAYIEARNKFLAKLDAQYAGFSTRVDRQLFTVVLDSYLKNVNADFLPAESVQWKQSFQGDWQTMAEALFDESVLRKKDDLKTLLSKEPSKAVEIMQKDPVISAILAISKTYKEKVSPNLLAYTEELKKLQRNFMKAQMEVFAEKRFYPDANRTMRVAYGQVKGYDPKDAVEYLPYTWLDGIMQKYIPGDYEFDVPKKLIDLYRQKDYGQYGQDGRMPVCFIGSNHTTGGNSGSPAMDGYGNLVGINFDRVWEGTMSDINYDPTLCRNIMVDIRYVLFVIDKYAGAGHLVEEMKLVHPKAGNSKKKSKP